MTESVSLNRMRNQYLSGIVQSLQLPLDEFIHRVADEECYESIIYNWTMRLFERGEQIADAVQIIHRARRVFILNAPHPLNPSAPLTLETLLTMLNDHSKYNTLDNDAKLMVQKKVAEMFHHNARLEAIEEVLEDINPAIIVDKASDRVTFIKITVDRIKNAIRRWNLTEYWQNRRKQNL